MRLLGVRQKCLRWGELQRVFRWREQKPDFEVKMVVEKILTQKPSQSTDCSGDGGSKGI